MRFFHYTIASGLGLGYSPVAPGTAGSLLALGIAFYLLHGSTIFLLILTIVIFFAGTLSATYVEKDSQKHDPSLVVVDEMIGMWISLLLVPHIWWAYLIAFALFRFFDIVKPFPINSLQNLPDGWGIMLDDVGAGIYALIATHIILLFF